MEANFNINAVLDRLQFDEPVNTTELLKFVLYSDQDELKGVQTDFKNRFVYPLITQFDKFYQKVSEKVTDAVSDENLEPYSDPLGLKKLYDDYKKKNSKKFADVQEKLASNLDKMVGIQSQSFEADSNDSKNKNSSEITPETKDNTFAEASKNSPEITPEKKDDSLVDENMEQNRFKKLLDTLNVFSDTKLKKLFDDSLKKEPILEEDDTTDPNIYKEKEGLLEKDKEVDISKKSIDSLSENLNKFYDTKFGNILKKFSGPINSKKEPDKDDSSFLSTLFKIVGVGALLTGAAAIFWPQIRKFLDDKFGKSVTDVFDKFRGAVEGMAKFFTLGTVSIGGLLIKKGATFLTVIGEALENTVSAFIKMLLPEAKVVAAGAELVGGAAGFLPKALGSIVSKLGGLAFKAIPVVGGIISLGFAYRRFKEGNVTQGIIELVGGLGGFLGPFGLPLSLGAAALNAFIDYKTAGSENKGAAAYGIVSDIGQSIQDFFLQVPIIGGLINLVKGISSIAGGDFATGLSQLNESPLAFTGIPSLLLSLYNSTHEEDGSSKEFSFDNFKKEIKKNMFKAMLSFVPNWFGLKGSVAKYMGMDYNDNAPDQFSDDPNMPQHEVVHHKYAKATPEPTENSDVAVRPNLSVNPPEEKDSDDQEQANNKINYTANEDVENSMLSKQHDTTNKHFTDLKGIMAMVNKNIIMMNDTVGKKDNRNMIVSNNNTTTQKDSISMSGSRDPIFELRKSHWNRSNDRFGI